MYFNLLRAEDGGGVPLVALHISVGLHQDGWHPRPVVLHLSVHCVSGLAPLDEHSFRYLPVEDCFMLLQHLDVEFSHYASMFLNAESTEHCPPFSYQGSYCALLYGGADFGSSLLCILRIPLPWGTQGR